jgi:hypothetical protein
MKTKISFHNGLMLALLAFSALSSRAQWITQSFDLKAGWNAVYLHVDARHATLDSLVGADVTNPIQEIWLWAPPPDTVQFIKDPQTPTTGNNWLSWTRSGSPTPTLLRLPGNVACLVRVTSDYTWNLKGKVVAPTHEWTGSGLNFLGFPTLPGTSAPTFDSFLTPAPDLKIGSEIFRYVGGAITDNPKQVLDLTTTKVRRGEAFWIRSATFNHYFGPFDALIGNSAGLDFGDSGGQQSFRLRNRTKSQITVRLQMVASEAPPTGQTTIAGIPPILMRGAINLTDLTYPYSTLSTPATVTLKPDGEPGSDVEVILGLNRSAMNFPAGSTVAGILRMTDSLNYLQADIPVSATVSSTGGLWIGSVVVNKVNQYLTTYQTAATTGDMNTVLTTLGLLPAPAGVSYALDEASRRIIKFVNGNGSYLVKNVNTDSTAVARPYSLRLIVHNNAATKATLLQHVFVGMNTAGDQIVATKESLLDPNKLATARRISAAHLPFSENNNGWLFSGPLTAGANVVASASTAYDDQSSNPFLHTYHPDHDNLDALFQTQLGPGEESYTINRQIRLITSPPADNFNSLTAAGTQLGGQYIESITLTGRAGFTRTFDVSGGFLLNRITTTPTLTSN